MLKPSTTAVVAVTMLTLCGCGRKAAAPTINASMTGVVEPTAQTIWDIASSAYNAKGDGLDAAKITDADWKTVGEASRKLKEQALLLADTKHIVVATENEAVLGAQAVGIKGQAGPAWDAVGPAEIQARINAKPALFTQKANDLANAADAMSRASGTKDAALLYKVSSGLDEVCDACHEPFWGTDEPPPVPH
jgi:hypothetical protein